MRLHRPTLSPPRRWALAAGTTLAGLVVLVACGGDGPEPADVVLTNGYVYTVDAKDSVAQAVAVRGGRIVYVGNNGGAQRYVDAHKTQVIDLGGRMLMPGLVDGHVHPLEGGAATLKCSLDFLPLTVAQMKDKLQGCLDASADQEPDGWLEVVNWDRQAMSSIDRDPTRQDIDGLATTRPIHVTSIDHHTRLVNTRALGLAGITAQTPNPPDGEIVHDANGQPTGIFEDGAGSLVDAALPPVSDADRAQHARIALALLRRQGVTSFMDAMSDEAEVKAFATLGDSGELTARAQFAMLMSPDDAADAPAALARVKAVATRYTRPAGEPRPVVEVRHVKFFLDGVLQAPAQTAGVLAPYNVDTGTPDHPNWVPGSERGQLYYSPAQLDALVAEAIKAGFDPHIHAIGDAAVRRALDAYDHARQQLGNGFRPAIAHVELADPADFGRFKSLGVVPVMSYQWAQQAPYSIEAVKDQLGPERYAIMEPEGSLMNAGATIAYGSDWPVDPMAYFYNLSVGVLRRGNPDHWASFGPAYAGRLNDDPLLPRSLALRSITMNSAWQLRLDDRVGSIERGKFADLIVLDRNFMQAADDDLAFTNVLLTMVGGQVVWADGPFAGGGTSATAASARPMAPRRPHVLNARNAVGHQH
ncbi:MAG: amidohydrolase [Burkholderiaceae bacterium]